MQNRLREFRLAAGYTLESLAAQLGVSHTTVQRWESGKRQLTIDKINEIANVLDCQPADLISGNSSTPRIVVKLVGYVGAGEQYYPDPEAGAWIGFEEVEAPPGTTEEIVAVRVRGSSMEPVYRSGDILYFKGPDGFDPEVCIGRDCVAQVRNGPAYVKRLERHQGQYRLVSYKGPPMDNVAIEWAQPILWVKRT